MLYREIPTYCAHQALEAGSHLFLIQMEDGEYMRDYRDLVGGVLLAKLIVQKDDGWYEQDDLVVVSEGSERLIMGSYQTIRDYIDQAPILQRTEAAIEDQMLDKDYERWTESRREALYWQGWILRAIAIGLGIIIGVALAVYVILPLVLRFMSK